MSIVVERLRRGDRDRSRAHALFAVMAEAFEEERPQLGDAYVDHLLGRDDMWILAACAGETVVGGLTAHVLPMTRSESTELFIYDLAVHPDGALVFATATESGTRTTLNLYKVSAARVAGGPVSFAALAPCASHSLPDNGSRLLLPLVRRDSRLGLEVH